MGRQPWAVAPNPTGVDGVRMMRRYAAEGLPEAHPPEVRTDEDERPPSFAY